MHVGRRAGGWSAFVVAVLVGGAGLTACGGGGSSDDTLDPLEGVPGDTGSVTTIGGPASTATQTVDPAQAGAGFVSVQVQVAQAGIDETLSLDRATVRLDELDPLSLDATCSVLDGGDPLALAVIDLRRLTTGGQVVSAALRTDEPATEAGEYDGTVEIADAEQLTTSYDATIVLLEGGWSGSFEGADENGNVASGTFVCAPEAVAPPATTVLIEDPGEEVPDTTGG